MIKQSPNIAQCQSQSHCQFFGRAVGFHDSGCHVSPGPVPFPDWTCFHGSGRPACAAAAAAVAFSLFLLASTAASSVLRQASSRSSTASQSRSPTVPRCWGTFSWKVSPHRQRLMSSLVNVSCSGCIGCASRVGAPAEAETEAGGGVVPKVLAKACPARAARGDEGVAGASVSLGFASHRASANAASCLMRIWRSTSASCSAMEGGSRRVCRSHWCQAGDTLTSPWCVPRGYCTMRR